MKKSVQKIAPVVVVTQEAAYRALDRAVAAGQLPVVTALIEKGLSATALVNGHTVLYTAVEKGHSEIAKFLIGKGGDPNENNGHLLFWLAEKIWKLHHSFKEYDAAKYIATAVVLINHGAELCIKDNEVSLLKALLRLCENDITNAIYAQHNVHVKAAWMAAAWSGNAAGIKAIYPCFLQNMPVPPAGENLMDTAVFGLTALHFAIIRSHMTDKNYNFGNPSSMVKFLLDHGANPEVVDEKGFTPLAYAKDLDTIKVLVGKGANIFAPKEDYKNIFECILASGNADWIEVLLLSPHIKASPELHAEVELCVATTRGQIVALGNFKFVAPPAIEAGEVSVSDAVKELELQRLPQAVIYPRLDKVAPFVQLADSLQADGQSVQNNSLKKQQ